MEEFSDDEVWQLVSTRVMRRRAVIALYYGTTGRCFKGLRQAYECSPRGRSKCYQSSTDLENCKTSTTLEPVQALRAAIEAKLARERLDSRTPNESEDNQTGKSLVASASLLGRVREDLDRVSALHAHLAALDEQLLTSS
jgi:hypothetical protein